MSLGPDGTETDITEGVRIMYETILASPKWDSGSLSPGGYEAVLERAETPRG